MGWLTGKKAEVTQMAAIVPVRGVVLVLLDAVVKWPMSQTHGQFCYWSLSSSFWCLLLPAARVGVAEGLHGLATCSRSGKFCAIQPEPPEFCPACRAQRKMLLPEGTSAILFAAILCILGAGAIVILMWC